MLDNVSFCNSTGMVDCDVRVHKINRTTAALIGNIVQKVDIGGSYSVGWATTLWSYCSSTIFFFVTIRHLSKPTIVRWATVSSIATRWKSDRSACASFWTTTGAITTGTWCSSSRTSQNLASVRSRRGPTRSRIGSWIRGCCHRTFPLGCGEWCGQRGTIKPAMFSRPKLCSKCTTMGTFEGKLSIKIETDPGANLSKTSAKLAITTKFNHKSVPKSATFQPITQTRSVPVRSANSAAPSLATWPICRQSPPLKSSRIFPINCERGTSCYCRVQWKKGYKLWTYKSLFTIKVQPAVVISGSANSTSVCVAWWLEAVGENVEKFDFVYGLTSSQTSRCKKYCILIIPGQSDLIKEEHPNQTTLTFGDD